MAVWYRFFEIQYAAPLNEYDEPMGSGTMKIHMEEIEILKETPKGVWLKATRDPRFFGTNGHKMFVLRSANKRYACPTVKEAAESFIARKERQAGIHEARARSARKAIMIMEAENGELLT